MNKTLVVAAAAAPMALAADAAAEMMRVSHTGTVRVAASPEDAFPLFTAPGERLWAPGCTSPWRRPAGGLPLSGTGC